MTHFEGGIGQSKLLWVSIGNSGLGGIGCII